jgi:hypothetical protein
MSKKEAAKPAVETGDGKTHIRPNLENYVTARSASGSKSQHNGDPVAQALQGATLEEVFSLTAEVLETTVAEVKAKYGHLNIGQQRMNCGNRIRGIVNKLNKEKDGSGDKYINSMASALRIAVKGREKELEAQAKAKDAEKLAKLKEKAVAEKAKEAAKAAKAKEAAKSAKAA